MNEKQKIWLKTMINTLNSFIDNAKMTDEDWESVSGFISVVALVCKGYEDEVRGILIRVADKEGKNDKI